jgi:hypothetical protein
VRPGAMRSGRQMRWPATGKRRVAQARQTGRSLLPRATTIVLNRHKILKNCPITATS